MFSLLFPPPPPSSCWSVPGCWLSNIVQGQLKSMHTLSQRAGTRFPPCPDSDSAPGQCIACATGMQLYEELFKWQHSFTEPADASYFG